MCNLGIKSLYVKSTIFIFISICILVIFMDRGHDDFQNVNMSNYIDAKYQLQVIHSVDSKPLPVPIPIPEGGMINDLSVIKSMPGYYFIQFYTFEDGRLVMEFYDGVFWNRLKTNLPFLDTYRGPETHYKFTYFTRKIDMMISQSPNRHKPISRIYSGYAILENHVGVSVEAQRLTPNDKKYKPSTPWLISLTIGPNYK